MIKNIFISILFFSLVIFAQEKESNYLTGSLKNDSYFVLNDLSNSSENDEIDISTKMKKPIVAGLLSFAIPGAGEVYTENYLKAGIFAAVEVAAIIVAVAYDNKGDDQTELFENYANTNWSAEKYAKWTQNNLATLNPELDPNSYNVFDGNGKLNWDELNRMESNIGGYYSHRLDPFGTQQYYEMIGKYSQFNVGWDEFGDENAEYTYGDPLVEQFLYYTGEFGEADRLYNVAKWAVIAVVSNHFFSALDAAWSASRYNKNIKVDVSINKENFGFVTDYYPQLNFKLNL